MNLTIIEWRTPPKRYHTVFFILWGRFMLSVTESAKNGVTENGVGFPAREREKVWKPTVFIYMKDVLKWWTNPRAHSGKAPSKINRSILGRW